MGYVTQTFRSACPPAALALFASLALTQTDPPTPADLLVTRLAIDSAAVDVPPIEIKIEGARQLAIYDRFRLIWLAAREARRTGQTLDPANLPEGLRTPRVVVLAFARSPMTGDTLPPQTVQLNGRSGREQKPADAHALLPGVEWPALTKVAVFDVAKLSPGDKLAVIFNDSSEAIANARRGGGMIPGTFNATIAAVLPIGVNTDVPPVPAGVTLPSARVDVHVEGILDLTGHIRYARALDGPPELRAAAAAAVGGWEYTPAKILNVPVPAVMQGVVTFKQ